MENDTHLDTHLMDWDLKYHKKGREATEDEVWMGGCLLELYFMKDLSWYISCCWSIADEFSRKKEGLTWHLKVEVSKVMGLAYLIWSDSITK